jgi:hypothetical protein
MTKQEKARWLSEMYAAMADGKQLQYQLIYTGSKWYDNHMDNGPYFHSNPEYWRIKPEPREVEALVYQRNENERWVRVPNDWPSGAKVRVTEILEDEALREGE